MAVSTAAIITAAVLSTASGVYAQSEQKSLAKEDRERREAEARKKKEEVDTINQADTLIYTTEKAMKDMEGKVDQKKLDPIKKQVDELKKLMEPEKKDIAKIKVTDKLQVKMEKLRE